MAYSFHFLKFDDLYLGLCTSVYNTREKLKLTNMRFMLSTVGVGRGVGLPLVLDFQLESERKQRTIVRAGRRYLVYFASYTPFKIRDFHAMNPNTSNHAARASLLNHACTSCIFSIQTRKSLDSPSSVNSLADNTHKTLVPPAADTVIRSRAHRRTSTIPAFESTLKLREDE